MKTTKDLLDEGRERSRTRLAERKEIEALSFTVRCEARRANEEIGQHAMATATFEALSTAERAMGKVDGAIDHLERLRFELIQIAAGERWHQTERPPDLGDLARELGEIVALLKMREVLAQREEGR